jgi:hypothetical protein
MSSTTSRVAFYKPAGGENVNVTTDLNNNLDKIDTNLNFRVVANAAARNAINPFWAGLNVRETDTGKLYVSNGSAPISASWDQILTSGTYATAANINPSATGTVGINMKAAAESNNRWQVRADGQMFWGGGSGAVDVNLYRANSTTLKTDDNFEATGTITTAGDLISTGGQLQLNLGGSAKKNAQPSVTTGPIANTTTETIAATYTISAGDATAGAVYKITAWGVASTTGTPTLTFKNRMGGVSGSSNASIPLTAASSVSNKVWKAELYVTILTTGGSGTWTGNLTVEEGISVAGANPVVAVTRMDGSGVSAINTTTSTDMCITLQWGTASASNSWTCRGFAAERIA